MSKRGGRQHFAVLNESSQRREPRLAMWRAVIYLAIHDLMGKSSLRRSDSLKWIKSRDFHFVCDQANLDPSFLAKIMYDIAIEQGARQKYILKQFAPWLLGQSTSNWEVPSMGKTHNEKVPHMVSGR